MCNFEKTWYLTAQTCDNCRIYFIVYYLLYLFSYESIMFCKYMNFFVKTEIYCDLKILVVNIKCQIFVIYIHVINKVPTT